MDLLKKLNPPNKKQSTDEKRRRLSFLKGKHKEQYLPNEVRVPKPKPSRVKLKDIIRVTKKGLAKVEQQAKKMPSDSDMTSFVWGGPAKSSKEGNEQKKTS